MKCAMTKIIYQLILIFLPALIIFYGAGSCKNMEAKDSKMAFETKDVAYPVRFANFQRNSNVPVMMKSRWNPVWFKKYSDINIDYSFTAFMKSASNP